MRTWLIICAFIAGFVIHLQAQVVPGYQGKRTFINYQVNISPALQRPTYFNKVREKADYPRGTAEVSAFVPFNTTHSLMMERVVGRKFALSFSYSFAASKDYFSYEREKVDEATGEMITYRFNNKQLNIFGQYYQAGLVFYGRNALAPFGKYFKLNLGYSQMNGRFTNTELESETAANGKRMKETIEEMFKTHSLCWGFSFGMNRIFKDRIIVNRGVSFFLPTKPDGYVKNPAERKFEYVKSTIARRLHFRDLATFYIGCGYLF